MTNLPRNRRSKLENPESDQDFVDRVEEADISPALKVLQAGFSAAVNDTVAGAPEKPKTVKDPDFKKLPDDLIPYADMMRKWVEKHEDGLRTFLDNHEAKFKIVYGDWFYYSPKKNSITLGVKAFRHLVEKNQDAIEAKIIDMDQLMFVCLHEVAHLKTTLEGDRAGKKNLLEFFKFLSKKTIPTLDDPNKKAKLGPTYGYFYNICEDVIVNYLVLNTGQFNSPGMSEKIRQLYAERFFQLFEEVGDGQGDYEEIISEKGEKKMVAQTGGRFRLLTLKDYQQGFEAEKIPDLKQRSGQFITLLIKHQMGVLDAKQAGHLPGSKYRVSEEVAAIFNKPLAEAFKLLMQKFVDKFAGDPQKLQRYLNFMNEGVWVKNYREKNNLIVADEKAEFFPNVALGCNTATLRDLKKLPGKAWAKFYHTIQQVLSDQMAGLTIYDLFAELKKFNYSRRRNFSLPLQFTANERTKILRSLLEPIFTLLCILDESFEIKLPPTVLDPNGPKKKGEGDGGGNEGDEGDDEDEEGEEDDDDDEEEEEEEDLNEPWQEGVEVINKDKNSVHFGKKGVIKSVETEGGEVKSVIVDYFEEISEPRQEASIAQVGNRMVNFTDVEDRVIDPVNNLQIVSRKKKGGKKAKKSQIEYVNPDEEKPDEGEKAEGGEDKEGEGGEPKEPKEPKEPTGKTKGKGKPKDKEAEQETGGIIKNLLEGLEEDLENEERKANSKAIKELEKTPDYQAKVAAKKEEGNLAKKIAELEKKGREESSTSGVPLANIESQTSPTEISDYLKLSAVIRPFAERMAKEWERVIQNIAITIQAEKDKYYREGKIDQKRLQRYFPEIEFGAEIDDRLIKEKIVEKLVAELKPRMLRLHLVIDNSVSMGWNNKKEEMLKAIVLLSESLRSLKVLFKTKLEQVLGINSKHELDFFTDIRISLFGNTSRTIKPFEYTDFSFLEKQTETILPKATSIDEEVSANILALRSIDCSESTYDSDFWGALLNEYQANASLLSAVREGRLTDVVIQVSDGDIFSPAGAITPAIEGLKKLGAAVGGFAIGKEGAKEALQKRHKSVILAEDANAIVNEFGKFLTEIIEQRISAPMIALIQRSLEK